LDEAIAFARKGIALRPDFAQGHFQLGTALYHKGKDFREEAIAAFRKVIDLDANFAPAHYNLGICYHKKGNLDEAIKAYRKAIALDPKCFQAQSNLGNVLRFQGKFVESAEALRAALAIQDDSPTRQSLALSYRKQGKMAEAAAEFSRALDLCPKGHDHDAT